jgi:glycosyltransferase involved in cell wall biosynthesis
MNKIGFIITTFLRDELLFKSVKSLLEYKQNNWEIIIIDQGNNAEEKTKFINQNFNKIHYYQVLFDSGLSYGRNFGVQKATDLECDYIVILADSIIINQSIKNINKLFFLFQENSKLGKIGFQLENRIGWEGWLSIIPNESFFLDFIDKSKFLNNDKINAKLIPCNICKNFYLATCKSLLNVPYDEKLKIMEHEDNCIRYSEKYETIWTDLISASYENYKPDNYLKYRKRMYNEFMKILLNKYNLKTWIQYKNLQNAKTN